MRHHVLVGYFGHLLSTLALLFPAIYDHWHQLSLDSSAHYYTAGMYFKLDHSCVFQYLWSVSGKNQSQIYGPDQQSHYANLLYIPTGLVRYVCWQRDILCQSLFTPFYKRPILRISHHSSFMLSCCHSKVRHCPVPGICTKHYIDRAQYFKYIFLILGLSCLYEPSNRRCWGAEEK